MTDYIVQSIFRDAKGKELRRSCTFRGDTDDARSALTYAHEAMLPIVAADPRIDSISSTVVGGGETISTVDYADELGCGTSSSGLMHEISADRLDGRADTTVQNALDFLTDEQKAKLLADSGKTKEVFGAGVADNPFPGREPGAYPTHLPPISKDAERDAQGLGGASVDVDPFRPGAGSNDSTGSKLPRNRKNATGSISQRQRDFAPRQGQRYGGSDIIQEIRDAQRDLASAGKTSEAFRLSPEAWDQLREQMERYGHLTQAQTLEGGYLLGLPIYKNLDPGAPPIQVSTRRKFATGGLVNSPKLGWNYFPPMAGLKPLEPMGKTDTRSRDAIHRIIHDESDFPVASGPTINEDEIDLGPGELFFDGKSKGKVKEFKIQLEPRPYDVPSWHTPLEPMGQVYGHKCEHIFIDEPHHDDSDFFGNLGIILTQAQKQYVQEMEKYQQRKYNQYILGKFPEDTKATDE